MKMFRYPNRIHRQLISLYCCCSQKTSKVGLRTLTSLQKLPHYINKSNKNQARPSLCYPVSNSIVQKKTFWNLSLAFNQVDQDRLRLVGPDRTAAEWVLRNGGGIKWKDSPYPLNDYNLLPTRHFKDHKVEEIDLTAADVIGLGFQHLENLQHVRSIKLHGCRMIMDDALEYLHFSKDTLEWLQISRCPMITDKGLQNLKVLKKLKTLVIYDLIELKDFDDTISRLGPMLPWCQILSDDPLLNNPENESDSSTSKD